MYWLTRLVEVDPNSSVPKPCDYFDLIGGVGTGGVIALMLGRLCMPIGVAIEKYVSFSKEIYSNVKTWSMGREKFKASVFESSKKDVLESAGFPGDVLMHQDDPKCKSFVVALPSANMTPRFFRTYEVNTSQDYNCTVVQAAHATTAVPGLFKPVSITSRGLSETFAGGLGHSNPTDYVLREAKTIFGPSK
ncbi:hypothetical protein C0992_011390 [Termitomyces sp. T32_za158]|nr:hypothetical protein C0992_011390 [Termitomyces sp. T32_za158]